ncbi:MAG: hypothetical protein KBD36_03370 [Alphaproteobacteria bacterium]|jgi:hypothetical protein|nr:hypothetical protein [Alphaproteobacteria bacterium]
MQNKSKHFSPLALSFFAAIAAFSLCQPDAYAVNAQGELGASVGRVNTLLGGNIMNVIMGMGIAASVVIALMKSSLIPLGIGIATGILYGFAKTWIDAVFVLCV